MTVDINKVPEYYRPYFDYINEESVVELLRTSAEDFTCLVNTFSNEKAEYRYQEGKWNVKDLIQHIIDAERVFVYRAMRFARNDSAGLSGFDQDDYVASINASKRDIENLMNEFLATRSSTTSLFSSLSAEDFQRAGKASGVTFSVEVLGYFIAGHLLHHVKIIREKYL